MLTKIFRKYREIYLERYGQRILPSHRRALSDIIMCRTEALGGQVFQCGQCGKRHYAYHSCRNRSCPQCHGTQTREWLNARAPELLPVPYFHLVFTLPKELRNLVRTHQEALLSALMRAAGYALMKLARDPRYLGGKIGILAVLHTWTRAMIYHPHVHCLVPGGGISPDGQWLSARKGFLVPVTALSMIFRAKFMELARKSLADVKLPESVWKTPWVVYAKPSVQGAEKVLRYLARYVHRIAITNNRILSSANGQVTFRYQDSRDKRWKTMTLEILEFMRRYLQHVLPRGFHKVRYYGLLAPGNRHQLDKIKTLLADPNEQLDACPGQAMADPLPSVDARHCPYCATGTLVWVAWIRPCGRSPP
jgi:hypothetical protein